MIKEKLAYFVFWPMTEEEIVGNKKKKTMAYKDVLDPEFLLQLSGLRTRCSIPSLSQWGKDPALP